MNSSLISHVLPEELTEYFNIIEVKKLCDIVSKKAFLSVDLEERNVLPPGYDNSSYQSKGFLSNKTIQDFPLRGKAVYLNIKRRRWRHKETKEEVRSDYSFITEGTKLTQELADFLKGTGRDPRRYD